MSRRSGAWAAWGLVVTAYVIGWCWGAARLPERVPTHFGLDGSADAWGSRTEHIVFFAILGVVLLLGMPALMYAATGGDGTFLNLPNKEYWLAPERRDEFRRRFLADSLVFVALTGTLMSVLQAVVVWSALRADDPPAWVFPVVIAAFLVAVAIWVRRLLARYRPPPHSE